LATPYRRRTTRLPIVSHSLHLQLIAARCDRYQNRKETRSLTKPSRFCACNKIKGVFNVMMALDDLQVCPRRTQSAYIRSYSSRVVWDCLTCISEFQTKQGHANCMTFMRAISITGRGFIWLARRSDRSSVFSRREMANAYDPRV